MACVEFSVKNVVSSALVNLFDRYAGSEKFANALFEQAKFGELKKAADEEISKIASCEKAAEALSRIRDADDTDDVCRAIARSEFPHSTKILKNICARIISSFNPKDLAFSDGASCAELEKIAEFFDLGEAEKRVIAFLYSWDETCEFSSLCCEVCGNASQSKIFEFIAAAIKSDKAKVEKAFKNLREKKVTERGRRDLPKLADEISEFIKDFDGTSVAEKFSQRLKYESSFALSTFPVPAGDVSLIMKMMASKKPRHILFYGEPGCGKTEFAKALARELGKDIYVPLRNNTNASLSATNIKAAIYAASRSGSIAVIDEADDFLETESISIFSRSGNERKGAVNILMDAAEGCSLWITNSIAGIAESTRRRFAYSLRFDGISDAQKELLIKNSIEKNNIKSDVAPRMKKLAKQYGLSAAGIALVLDKSAEISESGEELSSNIEKIARAHYELLSGKKSGAKKTEIDSRFDPEILNIDFPMNMLKQTLESYKSAVSGGAKIPMSFLFSGAPGAGKTQLGRFVAESLGMELSVKRMSEISSCYVGATEKNIQKMFLEAERDNLALMIDEADSLFYDRRDARHSWEISQTNEILAQMETFGGVLICTTNLADSMDSAAMRRFDWKIKFSPPTPEGRFKLYSKYFLGGKSPNKKIKDALLDLEGLCPGDFKAAWQKTRFIKNRPSGLLIDALKTELSYKKEAAQPSGRIGFC
ncbi:MAG: ATP-binding protein [Opitutales bacterium]|nr:ATP-binding protein [Opitutales bacterium]